MGDALLRIVIGNLQNFLRNELAKLWGVESQIQELSENLTTIHAVLRDAEDKQIKSHAVKDWLQKLSDATHVLDDILDECSIQSERLQSGVEDYGLATRATTMCLTRFNLNTILFRRDISTRMIKLVDRFRRIDEERRRFELRAGVTDQVEEDNEWRRTSSGIPEHRIYGRDRDRDEIVEFLLGHASSSSSEDLSVYPIIGMGGVGKTTLAQCVFNDDRVIQHFALMRIWVCVSNDFNVMRILQSIVESTIVQNPNLSTLESMQKKVQEVLLGKRYLLVLDDVWNVDMREWEKLKCVLRCGMKGTSVLVTTRLDSIASIMATCQPRHLLPLSEDDNLSLFKHHAFGPEREEHADLMAIGKEIARKCAGSPLASKVIGSLLRFKNEKKQWLSVQTSEFWDTPDGDAIMRVLKLSYFNLNLSLRRCFSFCAIYQEDFRISKAELIHLWMANDLIKSRENLEVEDVGNEVWEELHQRSFFQEVETSLLGNITFKIHDLFHELARSIMGEECKVYRSASLTNLSSRVHHINYPYIKPLNLNKNSSKKVESLRTFIEPKLECNFRGLPAFKSLRALCTSSSQLSALEQLTHLRYLNLCNIHLTRLPKCVCSLQKLQILRLERCAYLSCLPKQLTKLKDLRHLLIVRCLSLVVMPPQIGDLKCLKTLSIFIEDPKARFGLAELRDLQLEGKLHIKGLENVLSENDARSASLINKEELTRLYLSWNSDSNAECTNAERILEALEPHSNLKSFGMQGYRGTQFPSWMRNTSVLSGLVNVIFYDCKNCDRLPPLGKLPHLTYLFVSRMKDLKHIDDESYDGAREKAFKSLKKLTLLDLPNLESILRDETADMIPFLSELTVSCVPKISLPPLQSVEHLRIQGNEDMVSLPEAIVQNVHNVKTLSIESYWKLKVLSCELSRLSSLQELKVMSCLQLESFTEHVFQGLSSLRTLTISSCWKLKSLSEGVEHLTCLERLEILNCRELVNLPNSMNQLTSLCHVYISECNTLPEGLQRLPSLQSLSLYKVRMDLFPEWFGDMTSLQKLHINSCFELRSLPSSIRNLRNLHEVSVYMCAKLAKRWERATVEDRLNVSHILKFKIDSVHVASFCEKIQIEWNMRKTDIGRVPPYFYRDSIFDMMVDELESKASR